MLYTNKTLLEQLQLTELEIARRKQLLGFRDTDVEWLVSCKGLVTEHIDTLVSDFYARQTEVEEIALLIGDADTLNRLHSAQRAYVLSLFEGYYDLDYVNNRLRIGMVHKRIGVEPKLYLSAVKTLKDTISTTLSHHIDDRHHLDAVLVALDKLLYFDTTLVFDTYIRGLLSEVEAAKTKVQNYAIELEAKVAERTRQLHELAQHDTLTGLHNQRALRDYLRRELQVARRHRRPFALAFFDVDDFKAINDQKGHFAGDEILRQVADTLKTCCRDIDLACRWGGDEFCLALPDCHAADAELICQRFIERLHQRLPDLNLSIGIVHVLPPDELEPDALITQADRKMYEAKAHPGMKICR